MGETDFGLGHLVQLAIKAFNGVGRTDQTPHLLRVFEIGAEVGPVFQPGLVERRVLCQCYPKASIAV